MMINFRWRLGYFCCWILLWKWYQNTLVVHPVKTQVISSGVIWGVGDIAAQFITHSTAKTLSHTHHEDKEFKISWRRVVITSLFGFGFVGPFGHFWYEGMDRFIKSGLKLQPNTVRFVATKVAMDGLIFGPLDLLVFLSYMGYSSGKNSLQVKEDLKRDFLPAFILQGAAWPVLQIANFRYIPLRYQLLYVNIFCLVDSAFLSWLEQQQDASWKHFLVSSITSKGQDR
ncbi:uncharacterized protein LOC108195562 isoform X1 [Daucus carota subsp. sativus]|uniref:uncharacterized protein LOC108195562 isoform X1 n=1 Tax=Daucus carota subsp. sativus TaxID=79200 RepID=UPI0007B2DA2F|nr:PREDICTED: protein Mpv17-like isoform X2 [Daucus carota subsp. sativus]